MGKQKKQLDQCKHPNSRKTKALVKKATKQVSRQKSKLTQGIKQNIIGEKVAWFRDNLIPDCQCLTSQQTDQLIKRYLARFDEELEQIAIKNSIGHRKQTNRQHASREDIINMTRKRENEEYNTCGLEMPDVMNPAQVQILRSWNGELRFLQNMKLRRISKKSLLA